MRALISPDQSVPSRATPIITRLDCRFDIGSSDDANEERIDPEKI
jgi:hypothetical protein